eukprot:4103040-Alexandrium_andersonii.AAC.1
MSASLVGSEMCIRDRLGPGRQHGVRLLQVEVLHDLLRVAVRAAQVEVVAVHARDPPDVAVLLAIVEGTLHGEHE